MLFSHLLASQLLWPSRSCWSQNCAINFLRQCSILNSHLLRHFLVVSVSYCADCIVLSGVTDQIVQKQRLKLIAVLHALVLAPQVRSLLLVAAYLVHHTQPSQVVLEHKRVVTVIQVHGLELLARQKQMIRCALVAHLLPLSRVSCLI